MLGGQSSAAGSPAAHRYYNYWPRKIVGGASKRAFDLVAACILLVFLSPILAVASIAICLQDGGFPIFRHMRIGLGGRPFQCFKLRTMVKDGNAKLEALLASSPSALAEWSRTRKLTKDPRVTALGEFLRKTSIDELPQLVNVIRGEMSLIGPRPIVAEELSKYDLDRVHYLRARPGLTGLWQVSGRSNTSYARRVALDKSYTLQWSFGRDIGILLRTLPAVLFGRGAV